MAVVYIYIHIYIYVYIYICIYVYIYVYAYIHKCVHTKICTYICIHIDICIYKYIHTYIYLNIYVGLTASEVAKCAQEAGAVAMIYITVNDIMVTLPPSSLCLPRDWMPFAIASFNIPSNTKAAIAWRQMSSCQEASINFLHECA